MPIASEYIVEELPLINKKRICDLMIDNNWNADGIVANLAYQCGDCFIRVI